MMIKMMVKLTAVAVVMLFILSCTFTTPHENFKAFMQYDVGKNVDDPWVLVKRYPQDIIGQRTLPNGNIELAYKVKTSPPCIVFFEVDKDTNIIVSWRYEGNERGCAIHP